MSMKTWIAEFYPIPVFEVPIADAAAHSLEKWEGLTKESLAKHKVTLEDIDKTIYLGGDSCALCYHHFDGEGEDERCETCPLYLVRGSVKCDDELPDEKYSPFEMGRDHGDPSLMIEWLRKAVKHSTDEAKK